VEPLQKVLQSLCSALQRTAATLQWQVPDWPGRGASQRCVDPALQCSGAV